MKKSNISYVLILIISILLFIPEVFAFSSECNYKTTLVDSEDIKLCISWDYSHHAFTDCSIGTKGINVYPSNEITTGQHSITSCPVIYACYNTDKDNHIEGPKGGVHSDKNIPLYFSNFNFDGYEYDDCERLVCSNEEDSFCKPDNSVELCPYYDNYIEDLQKSIDSYKSCSENGDCSTIYTEYNTQLEQIRSWCNVQTANTNWSNPCAKNCLNFNKNLQTLLEGSGLENYEGGTCGMSGDLVAWLKNIIKWIKYIIPAIVIILGIIDFIRAIASDNDDEMKKAQQRFVKRLIAAALIFLVPLLIEFLLKTFKIGGDNPFCGLI